MQNKSVTSVLSDLIEVSEDGKKGFAEARDLATRSNLKMLFARCATDCDSAATELQNLSQEYGGEPSDAGSISGGLHRGWIKVKAGIEDDTDRVLLEEVERGQDRAKAYYTKALKANLPVKVMAVIKRQAEGALRNHDLIRDMRDSYKAAA